MAWYAKRICSGPEGSAWAVSAESVRVAGWRIGRIASMRCAFDERMGEADRKRLESDNFEQFENNLSRSYCAFNLTVNARMIYLTIKILTISTDLMLERHVGKHC